MMEITSELEDECVEVLVRTRGDDSKLEAGITSANTDRGMTSFETLVWTALALEEDPRDEHSYAYSDKKQACEGKEKDHCYSTYSKMSHRRVQSLSDENLYRSAESKNHEDSCIFLPHYQSRDSALDVTGFDTISEKCFSYDNINVKTVDVITDKCIMSNRALPGRILPGFSDPDISKMTLQNDETMERPSSVPNSPPSKDELTIEHSYFKSSSTRKDSFASLANRSNVSQPDKSVICDGSMEKSPLFDHSYDTSQKRKSLPGHTGVKRGRSTDNLESFDSHHNIKTADLTKSPFLDHSYQSFDLKVAGKRRNIGKKNSPRESGLPAEKQNVRTDKAKFDKTKLDFSKQLLHDHAYERVGHNVHDSSWKRNRSASLSEMLSTKNTGLKTDHSYTVPSDTTCMDDDGSTSDSSLSDSGTESLNEDEEENMRTTFESLDAFHDHSYVFTVTTK